jgi:hypothetical protein
MSSRKIEVESMRNLTINSLVRLATVVYVFIQYPHKKLQSRGVVVRIERKLNILTGTIL